MSGPAEVREVLEVEDIGVFETLNNPLRLRIMRQLMEPAPIKQVAQALDVPPTRLYYHFDLLEEAGALPLPNADDPPHGEPGLGVELDEDVAAAHPDVVARMKAEYDAWFDDVSSTRPDNYAPPRIHIGTSLPSAGLSSPS